MNDNTGSSTSEIESGVAMADLLAVPGYPIGMVIVAAVTEPKLAPYVGD